MLTPSSHIPKYSLFGVICILASINLLSQSPPSSGQDILGSLENRTKNASRSIFKDYPIRSIGPVIQGGRVSDLAVNPNNTHEYYVSFASGGVFRTEDNGITFQPIFDNQGALGVGDMALAPSNQSILYVGTGEKNSSRSSYAGSGIYKTEDKGKNWKYLGLSEIYHTGRVLIHPENPDIVWVAALGALYSHSPGRGVYKTKDGGKNWEKTLFINDSTGVVDLLINPQNPDQLWAATWERTRRAWNFKGNGSGSGIYRSDDGGVTWTRLAAATGFPQNEWIGRIGIDLCKDKPSILYALVDNQEEQKSSREPQDDELQASDFLSMSVSEFAELDSVKLNRYLRDNEFPVKYRAEVVKKEVGEGRYLPKSLADYLGDANKALFETKIKGAELYRSDDYGDNWRKVNSYDLEGVYHTYGYYFGEVRVVPNNPQTVYIFGVPLLVTEDGGVTFHRIDTIGNVHVDHQALWINPHNPKHLILGNDGGLYVSYSGGMQWLHLNSMPVGQFYTVSVDMDKPYNVYGGLQDNGVLKGSSESIPNKTKSWEKVLGGDGMFVSADPRNSNLIYSGYQFGHYFRIDRNTGKQQKITPKPDIGEESLRFNWRAPLVISQHHPDIIYIGANKLFRSLDQGESWEAISSDLTKRQPQGNVPFSTITCVSESPRKFGLLYVGTDDGNVYVTTGGGNQWTLLSNELPDLWISSIDPSPHHENQVYLSLNGYRSDDYRTYVYFSDDYGKKWHSLKGNLPDVVINVIKQDPVNPNLLYLGTDHGAYASLDHGKNWHLLTEMPNVAVYDLVVHPREHQLVLATHGRSIYTVDISPWQTLSLDLISAPLTTFEHSPLIYSKDWGELEYPWSKAKNPLKPLLYYLGKASDQVLVTITDEGGKKITQFSGPGDIGFHRVTWDLKALPGKKETGEYVKPGNYHITFESNGSAATTSLLVKEKPD